MRERSVFAAVFMRQHGKVMMAIGSYSFDDSKSFRGIRPKPELS